MQDVVLVIPMCEGPVRKAFETAGVTTQVVGSTHLNDIARVEPENGFDGALVDATSLAFNDAMGLCRQLRQREQTISPIILVLDLRNVPPNPSIIFSAPPLRGLSC